MEPTPLTLKLGIADRRELAPGAMESTTLELSAGELVRITALQDGLDVALRWFPPGEEKPSLVIDSPNGDKRTESLAVVAAVAGVHRLEVQASKDAKPSGHYVVTLEERRLATDRDRRAADLGAQFAAGEEARRGGRTEEALTTYRGLLPLAREVEDRSCEATLYYRVGWMEATLGNWDRAIEPFETSIGLFGGLADKFMEATALNRCADSYRAQLRVEEALALHQRALGLFRGIKDADGTVASLVSFGIDQFWKGDLDEATATLNEAIVLGDRFNVRDNEVLARSTLGELQASRGKFVQARNELEAAVAKATAIGREDWAALALLPLGEIDLREGRFGDAKARYSRALEVFRARGEARNSVAARLGLGASLLRIGDLEAARAEFEKAQGIAEKIHAVDDEAAAAMNLGRYHHARGEDALAVRDHERAIALFERLGNGAATAANRFGAARSLCRNGKLEEALAQIDSSLEGIEHLRATTANFDLRTSHLATKREYAELQVEVLMSLDEKLPDKAYADRALGATEKARVRQLVDLLGEARSGLRSAIPEAIATEQGRLRDELEALERRRKALANQETDPAVIDRLEAEQGRLLARTEELQAEARKANPRYAQLAPPEILDAEAMRKQLQAGDAMLVYWLAEPRSFLWVVMRDRVEPFVLAPRSKIEPLAKRFADLLASSNPNDVEVGREVGQRLAQEILVPARSALSGTRWIVVADGALQRVPFAALPNPASKEGNPVLERLEVVYLPSATVLAALRAGVRRSYSLDSLAVFADPVFSGDGRSPGTLAPLPNTRKEAEAIIDLAKPREILSALGLDANREAVLGARLKPYKILHFATHGGAHPVHPELSGLELSQVDAEGRPIQGTLTLQDIFGLDLDAELVVLSACNTGVGPDVAGEGLASLARGFFYAGAPRLVVSLWPVDDASTADLMKLFYRRLLRENRAPADALREAQRELRNDPARSDPYYWAGFVFVGDWRTDPQRWHGPIETKDVGGPNPTGRPPIDLPWPSSDSNFDEEGSPMGPPGGNW
ncbi:MAG: CHAT domain-containing protein [Acidobacteriota bacterium]